MSKFEPNSTIYFCKTGIDPSNKPFFETGGGGAQSQIATWCLKEGSRVGACTNYSFQRTDGRLMVKVDADDCDYETLQECDTIVYANQGLGTTPLWIIGNITGVVWINPNNTYVYYDVDYYCTYAHLIDWENSQCFVEREHIKEDWINNGGECPAFSNVGPEEDFSTDPDTPLYYSNASFFGNGIDPVYIIYSPYGSDGKKASFQNKEIGNVLTGLNQIQKNSEGEVDSYLNAVAESEEADLDRIPMIQTVPFIASQDQTYSRMVKIPMPWLYESKEISVSDSSMKVDYHKNVNSIKYRNSKCWSSQFCKIRLQSHEGDVIDYNPQWFGNGRAESNWKFWGHIASGSASLLSGIEPANIEMNPGGMGDFLVSIKTLPESPWVGNAYSQWKAINSEAIIGRTIRANTSLFNNIIGADASEGAISKKSGAGEGTINTFGNLVQGAANYAAQMGAIAQSIKQAKASGASVNGGFRTSANQAAALEIYGFQLTVYIVQPYIMNSVDDFFDVYGYRVNRVKVPETHSRPLWNFVKTHSAHVGGESLSFIARTAIEEMLNNGVTFWNGSKVAPDGASGSIHMGDYSLENREANRAVS